MKRWILPSLVALAAHLLLFSLDPPGSRPAWSLAESRTLQVALVAPPPAPVAARTAPPALPRSQAPVVPKRRSIQPAPKVAAAQPVQRPQPAPARRQAPEAPAVADLPTDPPSGPVASSNLSTAPSTPSEAAEVQASVPLYDLNPPPAYPAAARRRGLEGIVLLEVLVDPAGRPAEVRVVQSSGHELLDHSALKSVGKWRFRPATRAGRPQQMWVQVPVRFRLQ